MSLCTLQPYTQSLPINCDLVAYQLASSADPPVVTARRAGQDVPITAQVLSSTPATIEVQHTAQCDGETVSATFPTDYVIHTLALSGVEVGDQLMVSGYGWGNGTGGVVEAVMGDCPLPYAPECNASTKIDCDEHVDEPGSGCHAAGDSGLILAAVVVASLIRRLPR